ncbi:uncharacterized protein LOC130125395 [Lampris incognitus]|uniref:uncharacterized protein LOC130125395 n=1 Tax=Lampris incognitus TaxID=2546036 RepID=UPI0024B606D0|nr:uncharacterized protein LOC130125395 [Lampris incognitus]
MDESGLASDEAHPGTRGLTNDRSVELGSSPQLMCDERMPSDESDDAEKCKLMRRVELDLDMGSDEVTSDSSDYDGDGDEESVDVETVEETELGVTIANMRAVASRSLRIWDSCEDSGSAKQHKVIRPNKKTAKKDVNKEKRKNHTVLERQRRSEQRYLFNQLQNILNCDDPRAPKLRILSLALSEIKTLMETSKCLEEKKRRLTQAQSVYVKKISNLAGKPEELIKVKLKEIYEKKLMAAQRRKSLSVNPRPQPQIPTLPVTECSKLQLNLMHKAQAKVPVPLATNTAHLHRLKPQSYVARTLASDQITSPKTTSTQSLMEDNPQVPVAPVQVITHQPLDNLEAPVTLTPIQITQPQSKVEDQVQMPLSPVIPQASEPQDGHHTPDPRSPNEVCTLKSDVPHKPAVVPPPPLTQKSESESEVLHPSSRGKWVTLPLVRSKTGRIILPSSLKPARQGCFMLMVMGTDQEEDKNKADKSLTHTLLSDQSSLKDKNGSPSEAEQPLDNSEEGKSPDVSGPTEASKTSPNSLKNGQDVKSPLVELARLNKSILFPSVVLQPIGNNQEGDRMLNMSSKEMNAYLSLKPIDQPCTSKNLSQIPSPPVVRRGRGRPRKHALVIPVKQNKKISPVNKETSGQVKVRVVQDNPVPVKRRRGRPRKNFAAISKSLAVVTGSRQRKAESAPTERSRASSSLTNASQSQNSPFRLTRSQNRSITSHSESSELEYNTPRPVTRSALGKDFPSAKKKSWMDIEKELELE